MGRYTNTTTIFFCRIHRRKTKKPENRIQPAFAGEYHAIRVWWRIWHQEKVAIPGIADVFTRLHHPKRHYEQLAAIVNQHQQSQQ